ncbi:MAG: hypothetical protein Q4F85_00165 [Prevotella sp.]|nr:hypothetical protein [Prevotella sp.]
MEYMPQEGYNKIVAELKKIVNVDLPRLKDAIAILSLLVVIICTFVLKRKKYAYHTVFIALIFVLSSLFLFPVTAYSQRQVSLKETGSGKPVQYANVYTGKTVYYSDVNGSVELPDTVSSLKVSHICYADTVVVLSSARGNVVFLSPKTYDIPAVVVGKRTGGRQRLIGPMGKKESLYAGGRSGVSIGVYIPYKKEYDGKYICSIVADLFDRKALVSGVYEKRENAALRFDLRLADPMTNAPSSNSLIEGGVIYEGKSHGRTTIPLDYPVAFPESGIFVVLEWIVKGRCMDNVMYNPHVRMSGSEQRSVTWEKREDRQENWVNWNDYAGMQQLKTFTHARNFNANVGIMLSE